MMEQEWRLFGVGGGGWRINLLNALWWMWWFTVTRRPPFLADDVILQHPCHIFGVAVGSCAACCSDHMDLAPSCVCLAALSRLSLGPPLLHKGSRVVVFKRRIWFAVECITGMGIVNEIQWLAPLLSVVPFRLRMPRGHRRRHTRALPIPRIRCLYLGILLLKWLRQWELF